MAKVWIGNLPTQVGERDIEYEFRPFGRIINVWVARKPPGFVRAILPDRDSLPYITFERLSDARDACRRMDGQHDWRVELAQKQDPFDGPRPRGDLMRRSPPRYGERERYRRTPPGRYYRSPPRRRYSPSPPPRRHYSPVRRYSRPPARRYSRSPVRRRSRSPVRRASRSPVPRRASPTPPPRRDSRSPPRRDSAASRSATRSPGRSRSRSEPPRETQSRSPRAVSPRDAPVSASPVKENGMRSRSRSPSHGDE